MIHSESVDPPQPVQHWAQLSDRHEASGNYLGACDAALLGLWHPEARELQYRAILRKISSCPLQPSRTSQSFSAIAQSSFRLEWLMKSWDKVRAHSG